MKKTLIIDGGLGRCIASIPALESFVKNNPETYIIVHYWTGIFWGNKILDECVWDSQTKGLFDKIKNTKIIKPEPYYNSKFLNEQISMIEAFDEEINQTCNKINPKLYFSKFELNNAKSRINSNKKTIVYQPFGSGAIFQNNEVVDKTSRSLDLNSSKIILNQLKKAGHQVILFDTKGAFSDCECENMNSINYRDCAAIISQSDYFIGVDSCGMHIAYATEKPGTTFFGSTSEINYGYPGWFNIVRNTNSIKYMPMRLADFDSWLAEIHNNDSMSYTDKEVEEICDKIIDDIKKC